MTKYALLRCYPGFTKDGQLSSGNNCMAECLGKDIAEAIQKLQPHCPGALDGTGYVKVGEITWVIAEGI
jgi:hypothetical protein